LTRDTSENITEEEEEKETRDASISSHRHKHDIYRPNNNNFRRFLSLVY